MFSGEVRDHSCTICQSPVVIPRAELTEACEALEAWAAKGASHARRADFPVGQQP